MKEQDICRNHAEQREKSLPAGGRSTARFCPRRASENQDGEDAGIPGDGMSVQRTIRDLMQAMLDGRLDEDSAGAMLDEIALRQGMLRGF